MEKLSLLLQKLVQGEVDFVLVGGYAAVAHGASIMTRDVDICCRFSFDSLKRLQRVLADVHPRHRMTPQKLPLDVTEENSTRLANLYLETDLGVLDCLSEVAGVGDFEAVTGQAVEIDSPAGKFRILALDALIRAKETMGRPHDRLTVRQLLAIKERMEHES